MTDEDLERAKKKVEEQTRQANRRASMGKRLWQWYSDQYEQNGFREMIDQIVGGKT